MANFGKGFVQGFDLRPTVNLLTNYMLQSAAEEKERQKRLEQTKLMSQQLEELSKIYAGGEWKSNISPDIKEEVAPPKAKIGDISIGADGKIMPGGINIEPPDNPTVGSKTWVPMSKEERFRRASLINPEVSKIFDFAKKVSEPEPIEYTNWDYTSDPFAIWATNKNTGQRVKTSVFTKENPNPEYKRQDEEIPFNETYDKKTNKLRREYGKYDRKLDSWLTDTKNNKLVTRIEDIAITKEGKNGERQYSDQIKKLKFDDRFKQQQEIQSRLKNVKSGGVAVDDNGQPLMKKNVDRYGVETYAPITAADLETSLNNFSNQWANEIKDIAPEPFLDWYGQLYNSDDGKKKKKGNPSAKDFWNNLKAAYQRGDFKTTYTDENGNKVIDQGEASFEAGINLFRATYKFDPLLTYGE